MKVLIVGGSVVGASAALFLAARGISPVLVEKHVTIDPRLRAKIFYPSSMAAYAQVGTAGDIRAIQRSRPPADHAAVVASLSGREIRRWLLPAAADPGSGLVKQADLEGVVRAHAARAGADLRFGHRLLDLRDDGDSVWARIAGPGGQTYTIGVDYVLACDGNASGIREGLGIGRTGDGAVRDVIEIGFRADLRPMLDGRRLAFAWTQARDFLSWTPEQDRGALSINIGPENRRQSSGLGGVEPDGDPRSGASESDERYRAIVAAALGTDRFVLGERRPWRMAGWVADRYGKNRIFLLGDAAHVTPPAGGFGANLGIADAWNLTTKLVNGETTGILEAYENERRPIALRTVDQALLRVTGTGLTDAAVTGNGPIDSAPTDIGLTNTGLIRTGPTGTGSTGAAMTDTGLNGTGLTRTALIDELTVAAWGQPGARTDDPIDHGLRPEPALPGGSPTSHDSGGAS